MGNSSLDTTLRPALSPVTAARYGLTAQAFHWVMFALIVAAFGIGLWMAGLPIGPQRFKAVPLHKAIGFTILATPLTSGG